MPISTHYDEALGIMEMRFEGRIGARELDAAVNAALSLARTTGARRLLADCAGLENGPSVADLYYLSAKVAAEGPDTWKDAIIRPKHSEAARDVVFWESTSLNRGLDVQVFPDRAQALAWLLA
ncbi:MAG: hypothetical protein U1F52_04530 [Burkholderiales bacterium]